MWRAAASEQVRFAHLFAEEPAERDVCVMSSTDVQVNVARSGFRTGSARISVWSRVGDNARHRSRNIPPPAATERRSGRLGPRPSSRRPLPKLNDSENRSSSTETAISVDERAWSYPRNGPFSWMRKQKCPFSGGRYCHWNLGETGGSTHSGVGITGPHQRTAGAGGQGKPCSGGKPEGPHPPLTSRHQTTARGGYLHKQIREAEQGARSDRAWGRAPIKKHLDRRGK